MPRTLADMDDLRVWVSDTQADNAKAYTALISASTLVRAYVERPDGWTDGDIPDAVREATVNIARRRALTPDNGVTDQSAGPFSVKRDTGLWLSATDRLLLDSFRAGAGVSSMTTRGVLTSDSAPAVTVSDGWPGSDPIPWE